MKKRNPIDQRAWHVERAQRCLTKAAAALLEYPIQRNALGFALLMAAVGLYEIACADTNEDALEKCIAVLDGYKSDLHQADPPEGATDK
jgi:hypothetical protein